MSGQWIIRVEGLHKSFGDVEVLKGVDMEISKGEVVVILGPSGSGKSTLLRCVNRLEESTGGKIFFEDAEVTSSSTDVRKVREKVGMVFQNFNLFPHLTAKGNVMLAQRRVLKTVEARRRAEGRRATHSRWAGGSRRLLPRPTLRGPAAARSDRTRAFHGPARHAVRRSHVGSRP